MRASTRSFYDVVVRRAVVRIALALDEALDLESLARDAALAPLHFHHVFRGMMLETPLELHRRLRLERAAYRLVTTSEGITRIALDAGYETHEAFTRAFRAAHGAAPSEFRKQALVIERAWVARFELAAPSGVHFSPESVAPTFHLATQEPTMHVDVETMPALSLAALRHIGPYHRISDAFARAGAIAARAGMTWGESSAMVAVYHDDPESLPADQLRADAGFTLSNDAIAPGGLTELTLPAGRYAHYEHVGPYTGLGDAWSRLMGAWLPRSGERIGPGYAYELYRNTPATAPHDRLRTGLYVPLA